MVRWAAVEAELDTDGGDRRMIMAVRRIGGVGRAGFGIDFGQLAQAQVTEGFNLGRGGAGKGGMGIGDGIFFAPQQVSIEPALDEGIARPRWPHQQPVAAATVGAGPDGAGVGQQGHAGAGGGAGIGLLLMGLLCVVGGGAGLVAHRMRILHADRLRRGAADAHLHPHVRRGQPLARTEGDAGDARVHYGARFRQSGER